MPAPDRDGMERDGPSFRAEAGFDAFLRSFPCVDISSLRELVGRFRLQWKNLAGTDIAHPCSHSGDNSNCWIICLLSPLNKFLHKTNVHVTEHAPGCLTLGNIGAKKVDKEILEIDWLIGSFLGLFLLKMHRCVQRIYLDNSPIFLYYPEALASSIAAASGLRDICFRVETKLPGEYSALSVIAALRQARELENLDLSVFRLNVQTSNALSQLLLSSSRLRSLRLMPVMSPKAAKIVMNAINSCASLRALSLLRNCHESSDKVFKCLANVLATNKTLTSLTVTSVTTKAARRILLALHTCALEHLAMDGQTICDRKFLLPELHPWAARLKSLRLSFDSVKNVHICSLAFALLADSCVLEKLDISGCDFDDLGAALLARVLVKNRSLKLLWLDGNLTAEAIKPFVSSLAQNSTIERVRLGSLDVDEGLSFNPVERMIGRLVTSWNRQGMKGLSRALRSNSCTVSAIKLYWTRAVSATCASRVFRSMCVNKHLTELSVYLPNGQDFTLAIIYFLRNTQSLRRLKISSVATRSEIVGEVLHVLSENNSIVDARFPDWTLSTKRSADALEAVLMLNRHLTSLSFKGLDFEGNILRHLALVMTDNYIMTELNFTHLCTYSESYAHILDILTRNLSLMNRAILFLRTDAAAYLDDFRRVCNSYAFETKYAASENIPLQAARGTIAAALDWYGSGTE